MGQLNISGAEVDLGTLPLAALLSASWVFTLAIALRYCQVSINIERQYSYLHMLEEKVSQALKDEDIYRREGKTYQQDYPLFSDWAWFCYVVLFPLIVVLAALVLAVTEWATLPYPWPYKLFDSTIAAAILASFFLYRIVSLLPQKDDERESGAGSGQEQ